MSRFSTLGSIGAVGSLVAVLSIALAPAAALAKNPSGGGMSFGGSSFHQIANPSFQPNKGMGNMPLSKNVGNLNLSQNKNLPITKLDGDKLGGDKFKKPIDKVGKIGKIGSDPISKTPLKCPIIDPCHHDFCHHDCCCHPYCHWLFFPLIVEDVVYQCVYDEPVYTLYYEKANNDVRVYSRYELPSESATLFKTERLLDKASTAWWLVDARGNLVDTNTGDKAAAVEATAAVE